MNHHVINVLKILLPIPVDCQFVTLVVVVKKRTLAVQNAPVVSRVNLVQGPVAGANNAPLVNREPPMMIRPILVRLVTRGIIKKIWAKLPVCPAFRANIKM